MPRINIEEQAWRRIYRLAEIMGCEVREAAGTVACLWGNSQDLVKSHGSKSDIIEWASLFNISDDQIEKWISGLEKSRFLSQEENGLYEIRGNKIQLENLISKTTRASKGGQALKKKLKELKRLKAGVKPAYDETQAGSKGLKSNQVITNQNKSKQIKSGDLSQYFSEEGKDK